MQPIDSIRTDRPQTIHSTNGGVGVILPKIEFVDNIPTNSSNKDEEKVVEKRIIFKQRAVELTADSTNYLIIAPKKTIDLTQESSLSIKSLKNDTTPKSFNNLFSTNPKELSSFETIKRPEEPKDSILVTTQVEVPGHQGIKKLFSVEQQDGVFALLLLCFFFFAYVFKNGLSFFKETSRAIFSTRKNSSSHRETTVTVFWYNIILLFQSVLLIAIISFDFLLEKYKLPEPSNYFTTIISIIIAIYLFIAAKMVFYRLSGYIFNIQDSIRLWTRNYLLLLEIFGIIAFIPTLLLIYSDYFQDGIFIFLTVLFIAMRLIVIYRVIVNFLKEKVNFLFLIVYLCTIEILPYYFLYRGLIFLYKLDITNTLLWH